MRRHCSAQCDTSHFTISHEFVSLTLCLCRARIQLRAHKHRHTWHWRSPIYESAFISIFARSCRSSVACAGVRRHIAASAMRFVRTARRMLWKIGASPEHASLRVEMRSFRAGSLVLQLKIGFTIFYNLVVSAIANFLFDDWDDLFSYKLIIMLIGNR